MLTRYPDLDDMLDLQYEPIVNENPGALTRQQIDDYNEKGYVGPLPLFVGDELDRVRSLFRDRVDEISHREAFESYHHTRRWLYDVVSHPLTVARLNDLLGPNVICHVSEFINKPPKQEKGGNHHQDASFNPMDARCPIVWLTLDDADVENGCMWFIDGSHKVGLVECDEGHYVVDPSQYGEEHPCEVPAGHCVIISDLLMHSSPANRSETRYRPGFTATYAPAALKPHKNGNRSAILVSGEDQAGHWQAHSAPEGD